MAVINDYKCPKHGYFESRKPQCPMKDCHEEVMVVFLQAPNLISNKTKFTDKSTKQLAIEFGMSDIKTTREGEHQEGFLTKKNKFTEKEYEQAEKYATRKKGVDKDKLSRNPSRNQKPRKKHAQAILLSGEVVRKASKDWICNPFLEVVQLNLWEMNK